MLEETEIMKKSGVLTFRMVVAAFFILTGIVLVILSL